MAFIEKVYEGGDLVIPHSLFLELGIKPGEIILIYPKTDLYSVEAEAEERVRLVEALDELYGAWSEEDEAEFNRARKEMWARWQRFNLS